MLQPCMTRLYLFSSARIYSLFIFLCLTLPHPLLAKSVESLPQTDLDKIIQKMSLKEKVGQLFAFDYIGQDTKGDAFNIIYHLNPGAIITFKRNLASPYKISRLNYQLSVLSLKKTGIIPFIMIDQEGGLVTRIQTHPPASFPSALSIGTTRNSYYSERIGGLTGKLLRSLGFHMNLAPVLDISDPYKKSFIGNRSYGKGPIVVRVMGESFARGLEHENILPTFKHFPGHGGITQDSHFKMSVKLATLKELEKKDIQPFKQLIHKKTHFALMMAHVAFPNIDTSGYPATFSRFFIKNILREKYGYEGLILTDDLQMAGSKFTPDMGERAIAAINAGCDLIIITGKYSSKKQAYYQVYQAVQSGRISLDRLHESLKRILKEKNRLQLIHKKPRLLSPKSISKITRSYRKNMNHISSSIVINNMKDELRQYPELKNSIGLSEGLRVFATSFAIYSNIKKIKNNSVFHPLKLSKETPIDKIMTQHPNDIGIFYLSGMKTARILNRLKNITKSKLIVINATYPGVINYPQKFKAVLNLNTRHPQAGKWLISYLMN